jgi:outer membrane biosynthesis protein TonB
MDNLFKGRTGFSNPNNNDCSCKLALKAFNEKDLKIALFILNNIDENCACDCTDDNCNSILHHLVLNCENTECINVLHKLLQRCDICDIINIQNNEGSTALHVAVEHERHDVADCLIDAGADTTIINNQGFVVEKVGDENDVKESTNIFQSRSKDECNQVILNIMVDNENACPDLTTLHMDDTTMKESEVSESIETLKELIKRVERKLDEQPRAPVQAPAPVPVQAPVQAPAPAQAPVQAPAPVQIGNIEGSTAPIAEGTGGKGDDDQDGGNIDTEQFYNNLTNKISNMMKNNDTNIIMKEIQDGGNSKIMGYRKLNSSSFNEAGLRKGRLTVNKGKSAVSKDSKHLDHIFSDSSDLVGGNELQRMINTRKSEIHMEVLNMIMEMLNKGEIRQDNKPIEASEKNAKLVKAYMYKVVSEKNPQMNGMEKISLIKNMNNTDITTILKKLPNLDKLEKEIQEHIEKKRVETSSEEPKGRKEPKERKETKERKTVSKKKKVESTTDTDTNTESD